MRDIEKLVGICLLAASVAWAAAGSSDARLDDYFRHCGRLDSRSAEGCAGVATRLDALAYMDQDQGLALAKARRYSGMTTETEHCAEVRAHLEEHPNHAEGLHRLALFCTPDMNRSVTLLAQALDIDPRNFHALESLLYLNWLHDEDFAIDPATLATYRETLYEIQRQRARVALGLSEVLLPIWTPPYPRGYGSSDVWNGMFSAARYILEVAARAGEAEAAAAIRARVRRDAGLDVLDYAELGDCKQWDPWPAHCGRGTAMESLVLACDGILYDLDLEDICATVIERVAGEASAAGLAIPHRVLLVAESAVRDLRTKACYGRVPRNAYARREECYRFGQGETESVAVARIRAALEHHAGHWSAEHQRVHAMGFLGDTERLDALREVLRADPGNGRARCNLASALASRGKHAAAEKALGSDGDPKCLKEDGFTFLDQMDYEAWREAAAPNSRPLELKPRN